MEIKFDKQYLSELYYTGKSGDKKHRFQPQVIRNYKKCIDLLESVPGPESLYRYTALHYETLQGNKDGLSSVRINDKYRIEMSIKQVTGTNETIVNVCNITELSNHYK